MTVQKIESFLTIAGRNIDRNFGFIAVNALNSAAKTASLKVRRNYFLANKIETKPGDACHLSLSVNNGAKILIFSGNIKSMITTARDMVIEAAYSAFDGSEINETYKDTSYKDVLTKLAPNLQYQTENVTPEQIVLQGSKEENFRRAVQSLSKALRRPLYYSLTRENSLILSDNILKNKAKTYTVDDMLLAAERSKLNIFPIPELEIGDKVKLRDKEYIVKAVTFDFSAQALMRLEVL